MDKFLLGFLAGAVAALAYRDRRTRARGDSAGASPLTVGHVDELSSASRNAEASALNAGDGTPTRRQP